MKRYTTLMHALAMIGAVGFIAGCSDDDNDDPMAPVTTEFEKLATHMESSALDLPDLMNAWIIGPQDVFDGGLSSYFIIDIRVGDKYGPGTSGPNGIPDFEDGHIEGAHNVSLADVVSYEANNNTENKPVIVACWTGHSAGHAVMALRLSGESTAKVLKWGMSGWHGDFDLWSGSCANVALDYPGSWVNTEPPALSTFLTPQLATGRDDGAAILEEQVENRILDGYNGIANTEVLGNYGDYHTVNYWARPDWDQYGHIEGSYQVTPGDLSLATISMLDPDETVVVYCWTGHTASMVSAWLNAVGYDAKGLSFSANGMIYDDLQAHKWNGPADLPYISAATEFTLLTDYMKANDLDLPDVMASWIIGPQDVFDAGLENYFIIDIRKGDKYGPGTSGPNGMPDFEDGHIPTAHSVALADVVTYEAANNTENKPVVVYCYTGHSAGHAVMALRLNGESTAKSLKWGMSGWNSDFDLWSSKIGNLVFDQYGDEWVFSDPPAMANLSAPELATGLADASAILANQVTDTVLDGFNGIANTDVLDNPDDYHIINYWARPDWDLYGHIKGSYQVAPGELSIDNLEILDPNKPVVVYCWTGQTASMVAAWLNVVGYSAVDLSFGVNALIYDDLQGHKWSPTTPLEFDYDTGMVL